MFTAPNWPKQHHIKQYRPRHERSQDLVIHVIGHATVLIQMNGINILTDPNYSHVSSPVAFAGPERITKPGIRFSDLPKIDLILISHNHYDHLDLPTLEKIYLRDDPLIFAGLGTKGFLHRNGIDGSKDMDWWESTKSKGISITFVPAQHWSMRATVARRSMLWGGFYIKGNQKVYFAGDTGYGKIFKEIGRKMTPPDWAILPIGAYEPRWFMRSSHMNPADSVQAFLDIKAKRAIAMHFGTFADLADEKFHQPKDDLKKALDKQAISTKSFIVPEFGKPYTAPP